MPETPDDSLRPIAIEGEERLLRPDLDASPGSLLARLVSRPPERIETLPRLRVERQAFRIPPARASRYAASVAATYDGRTLPPLFADAILQDLLDRLLFEPPFRGLRLERIGQSMLLRRPLQTHERPDLSCSLESAGEDAQGLRLFFRAEARVGGETCWEGRTELLRRSGAPASTGPGQPAEGIPFEAGLDEIIGYSRAAGAWGLLRLLRTVAPPMWLLGRCLALVEDRLPEGALQVEARFGVPMRVPGRAVLQVEGKGELTLRAVDPSSGACTLDGSATRGSAIRWSA